LGHFVVNETKAKNERQWRRSSDFRIICDCQHHRRNGAVWKRALRIASRGAAVLVGIPLAFAAFDINSAVNVANITGALRATPVVSTPPKRTLPMFTTRAVREQFLSRHAAPDSLTIDMFKEAYFREHVPYGAIIFREARKNDLAPELVAAMVHTESDFRTTLVSEKSAQGLMQIVPSTARELGIQNPFDPEQNIAAGTKYFRYLLNRFDNEAVALAAYNAGEGNVERFGGIPPFRETQNYITRVNRRTDRYRQRVQNTYMATLAVQRESVR
jgi:hypothetical protein